MSVTDFSPYAQIHSSLPSHRKTYALARVLGIKRTLVVGMVVRLWLWALEDGTGVIDPPDEYMLADIMEWDGDKSALARALLATRWIDLDTATNAWLIHGWNDYTGNYQIKRADRLRQNRDAQARHRQHNITQLAVAPLDCQNPPQAQTDNPEIQTSTHDVSIMSALRQPDVITQDKIRQNKTKQENSTGTGTDFSFSETGENEGELVCFREIYRGNLGEPGAEISRADDEKLLTLATQYPQSWFLKAVAEACRANVLKLAYVEAILQRYEAAGGPA